jgi:hypothetical protein
VPHQTPLEASATVTVQLEGADMGTLMAYYQTQTELPTILLPICPLPDLLGATVVAFQRIRGGGHLVIAGILDG